MHRVPVRSPARATVLSCRGLMKLATLSSVEEQKDFASSSEIGVKDRLWDIFGSSMLMLNVEQMAFIFFPFFVKEDCHMKDERERSEREGISPLSCSSSSCLLLRDF